MTDSSGGMPGEIWAYTVNQYPQGDGFGHWYDQDVSGPNKATHYVSADKLDALRKEAGAMVRSYQEQARKDVAEIERLKSKHDELLRVAEIMRGVLQESLDYVHPQNKLWKEVFDALAEFEKWRGK